MTDIRFEKVMVTHDSAGLQMPEPLPMIRCAASSPGGNAEVLLTIEQANTLGQRLIVMTAPRKKAP